MSHSLIDGNRDKKYERKKEREELGGGDELEDGK